MVNTPREGDWYTSGLQWLGRSLVSLGLEKLQAYPFVSVWFCALTGLAASPT